MPCLGINYSKRHIQPSQPADTQRVCNGIASLLHPPNTSYSDVCIQRTQSICPCQFGSYQVPAGSCIEQETPFFSIDTSIHLNGALPIFITNYHRDTVFIRFVKRLIKRIASSQSTILLCLGFIWFG